MLYKCVCLQDKVTSMSMKLFSYYMYYDDYRPDNLHTGHALHK